MVDYDIVKIRKSILKGLMEAGIPEKYARAALGDIQVDLSEFDNKKEESN